MKEGEVYAKLKAIKKLSPQTQATWLYECECGALVVAGASNVAQGRKKSCGCLKMGRPLNADNNTKSI